MAEEWVIRNMYPKGRGIQNTIEELDLARQRLLDVLRNRNLIVPYKYFILFYGSDRIKFGIKTERDIEEEIIKIKNELRQRYDEYSNLIFSCNGEDPNTAELIAVATELRERLLEKYPNWIDESDMGLLLHFMLNPYGYDREAWAHLLALLDIEGRVTDQDVKDVVVCIRGILQAKDRIGLENNRWVLKRR